MEKKYKLEERTMIFSVDLIKFISVVDKNSITQILNQQLLKAGTSIGANYREANRAESTKDFIHKIAIVQKEASETQYWLELFCKVNIGDITMRSNLLQESTELLAIFTSIGKKMKEKKS